MTSSSMVKPHPESWVGAGLEEHDGAGCETHLTSCARSGEVPGSEGGEGTSRGETAAALLLLLDDWSHLRLT